jgi:hypothetical protein
MRSAKALLTSAVLFAILAVAGTSDAAPKKPKPPKDPKPAVTEDVPFDKAAASTVLAAVDLAKCKSTNAPRGEGHVMVTFAAVGNATEAVVDKGPWVKTPVAKCIANEFKKAKVPAFTGDAIQVGKSFRFD